MYVYRDRQCLVYCLGALASLRSSPFLDRLQQKFAQHSSQLLSGTFAEGFVLLC